jgi:multiple sugar transport system substrate-binding protein
MIGNRRILAATAAVALALSAAACSGDDGGGDASGALTMWTFKRTHVEALQQAAAAFKGKTGIDVKIEAFTPDDVFTAKVQSAAQTKDLPDVLELHSGGEDMRVGGGGLLADLKGPFDGKLDRFLETTRESGRVTQERKDSIEELATATVGSLYSVPFTAGTFGIVYANKAKMQAAGLDPAKPPATWEEFLGYLSATTKADKATGGLSLGLKVTQTGFNWIYEQLAFAYLGQQKFEALFGKGTTAGFGSPDGVRTLDLYARLRPYWIPGATALGIDEADIAFAQGKSAFNVGGTFTLAFLAQNGLKPADVLTFPIPPATGGAVSDLRLAPLALTGLSITSTSANQDAAAQWVDFLTSAEGAGIFAKGSLDLPATDLGAQAESVIGPDLAALQQFFTGSAENTYDAANRGFRPPDYDEVEMGNPLLKLSPLGEADAASTGKTLDSVIKAMWDAK